MKAVTDEQIDSAYREVWSTVTHNKRLASFAKKIAIQAVLEERERCSAMASMFSMSPQNCTVHPDVPFGAMSESAQSVAHMTAQGIAAAIRAQPEPEA